MISRRNFLKYTGLAIAAAGTGFTSGKLSRTKEKYFVLQGFVPEDENILKRIFSAAGKNLSTGNEPVIFSSGINTERIKTIIKGSPLKGGSGKLVIRINRLDKKIQSDILLSDKSNYLYEPGNDYTILYNSIREQLKDKPADLFLSIEYSESGFLSSLLNSSSRTAVLHNHEGIFDKIDLSKNYSGIIINGSLGKTSVDIKNGMVGVSDSCCKNKICSHSGYISHPGNIIACAPNKVLIRIENA